MHNSRLIVIGASAGGIAALNALVAQFPKDFPAPVFIVNHMSADTTGLLAQQTAKIEETLWVALRMFEERQNLLVKMSSNDWKKPSSSISRRAKDSQGHIDRIRAMLKATDKDQATQSEGAKGGESFINIAEPPSCSPPRNS